MQNLAQLVHDHIAFLEFVTVVEIVRGLGLKNSPEIRQSVVGVLKELGRASIPVYNPSTQKTARFWIKQDGT